MDAKVHQALKGLYKKRMESSFLRRDVARMQNKWSAVEDYDPVACESLWPLMLLIDFWTTEIDIWLQILEGAVRRKDIACLKLLALEPRPLTDIDYCVEKVLKGGDSKKSILEWLLQTYPLWTLRPEDLITAASTSRESFILLQQHNLRAHYTSMDRVPLRNYVKLDLPCLTSAVVGGEADTDGEHLLEFILRQPDYRKEPLGNFYVQEIESTVARFNIDYQHRIHSILRKRKQDEDQEEESRKRDYEEIWEPEPWDSDGISP